MTRQEAFDKAYAALRTQNKRCVQMRGDPETPPEHPYCMYLESDGGKCAIGHLLNAEQMAFAEDHMGSVRSLISNRADLFDEFASDINFYVRLQSMHDNITDNFATALNENALRLARDFDLKFELPS